MKYELQQPELKGSSLFQKLDHASGKNERQIITNIWTFNK
jgi:hypothetical protein